ncbi:phosphate ABC transporter substrate-binding/OmpA family protein [Azospirillum picis]|uniref:Phosphate transport system substrate-binding protein n=1 Tax=Azospirillum picis TaxID=488438 RepID=A0ABU0MN79_9PROT|nr:phosphate ABC transporter substrate-binding/OmpA family protein [Azospirillum picis]MBP2301118.1 phosphate transport system substrate-binding protein [Azospirillum picis]MDQ0534920.1 phosphate transport system substrate-binding protein [Azospirillum picis]
MAAVLLLAGGAAGYLGLSAGRPAGPPHPPRVVAAPSTAGGDAEIAMASPEPPLTAEPGAQLLQGVAVAAGSMVPVPASSDPMPETPVILRLSGSNTIGSKLAPMLVERFLSADGYELTGRRSNAAGESVILASRNGTRVAVTVATHGSATAFTDLEQGKADLGMASRPITPAEATWLSALGDMTSASSEHAIALDGVAVVVHRTNPLTSLSTRQIRDIFSGKVTDWVQVGGRSAPIRLYAPDDNSGTFDVFRSLVLGKSTLSDKTRRVEDSRKLSNAVAVDPNGIGFVGLPYIGLGKALAIAGEGDGEPFMPTVFTVSTESYPLSRRLFLYVPVSPVNPLVLNFIEFVLSSAGQAVIADVGFAPLTVEAATAVAPSSAAPREYKDLAAKARRLSVNFRFRSNASTLDDKAAGDLDRLVDFLSRQKPEDRGGLVLTGFMDAQEAHATNAGLSQQRAQIIAEKLRRRGVSVQSIMGLGAEVPAASNDTEEGREKNRRVEVWLRARS